MDTLSPRNQNSKTTFIYGLVDPRTGLVRYVGKSNNPKTRLQAHIRHSKVFNYPVYYWIRKLMVNGLLPGLVILEEVSKDNWIEAESRWIQHYRQMHGDMLNVCHGGEGGSDIRNARRGMQHSRSKYNDELVVKIRYLRYEGASLSSLSECFNIPVNTVANICVGNSWKHIGGPITKGSLGGSKVMPNGHKPFKLTESVICDIRQLVADGVSHKEIARTLQLSKSTITRFIRREKRRKEEDNANGC